MNKYIRPKLCPSETLRLTVNQVITACFMGKHLQFGDVLVLNYGPPKDHKTMLVTGNSNTGQAVGKDSITENL